MKKGDAGITPVNATIPFMNPYPAVNIVVILAASDAIVHLTGRSMVQVDMAGQGRMGGV